MPVQYTSRRGKIYYLHRGLTKTGKPKYYFSMRLKGDLVDSIPEDYEIYEEPLRAQVFLQRKEPQAITDSEKTLVEKALDHLKNSRAYFVQVRGKIITIFESNEDLDELRNSLDSSPFSFLRSRLEETLKRSLTYAAVMRFTLVDEEHRVFNPERFCFRGAIDDWISIGEPDQLDALIKRFLGFLGRESFYELY
jgi:hypothetical protein